MRLLFVAAILHIAHGALLSYSDCCTWRDRSTHRGERNERLSLLLHQRVARSCDDRIPDVDTNVFHVKIASNDPLVYTVDGLLSKEECLSFREHVRILQEDGTRMMTLSNPPDISLNVDKLWPLPFLSLLAGIPPSLRLIEQQSETSTSGAALSIQQLLSVAIPPVIVALMGSVLLAYGIVLPLLRRTSAASSRTSTALALNEPNDFETIQPLVDRVTELTQHPWDRWEAPVVTRYDAGAVFSRHGDASPSRGSEWKDLGGQRVVTCICYLNSLDEGEGGETYFDQLKFGVQPKRGKGLVFFPAEEETWLADDRTTHESLPPQREKWIVQMFGRANRVPPPLGLPDSYKWND